MTNIIVASPSTGKTTAVALAGEEGVLVVELTLEMFDGEIDSLIKEIKELSKDRNCKAILLEANDDVMEALVKSKLGIIVVYPSKRLKDNYLIRFRSSGKTEEEIKVLVDEWEEMVERYTKFCRRYFRQVASIELRDPKDGVFEVMKELRIF